MSNKLRIQRVEIVPEVAKFLACDHIQMFVGGKWVDAESGDTFDVLDPGEGRAIAKVSAGGESDIGNAVDAAENSFSKSAWAKMREDERAVILHRLADLVDQNLN